MYADYHLHTAYSDDSVYPMEDVILDSIALGLEEICFTDHVDYGIKTDWDNPGGIACRRGGPGETERIPLTNVDYPRYAAEIQELREKYKDQIQIRMGLEFGMQVHTIPQYEDLFAQYPFDFILLSVHQVDDREFWTQEFQQGRTQEEYIQRYYQELLELVRQYHHYSVLAHLDLINRYDPAGPYPFEKIKPVLTEILKTVIADGKGIEVNTSSHRYGLADLTPSRQILSLYRDLGGTILTIGSDSHKKEHLGVYIRETMKELSEMGFHRHCTFVGMKPIFHDLG